MVFDHSITEVEGLLEEQRRLLGRALALAEDDELRSRMKELRDARATTDPARVRLLTDDRARMERVGYAWEQWAFDQRDLVSPEENAAYRDEGRNLIMDRLAARCEHPELAAPLEEDPSADPPGGTIVYRQFGDGASSGLVAAPAAGGPAVELRPPTGWESLRSPWVAADGRTIIAVAGRGETTKRRSCGAPSTTASRCSTTRRARWGSTARPCSPGARCSSR
jgi:hypothetical protein